MKIPTKLEILAYRIKRDTHDFVSIFTKHHCTFIVLDLNRKEIYELTFENYFERLMDGEIINPSPHFNYVGLSTSTQFYESKISNGINKYVTYPKFVIDFTNAKFTTELPITASKFDELVVYNGKNNPPFYHETKFNKIKSHNMEFKNIINTDGSSRTHTATVEFVITMNQAEYSNFSHFIDGYFNDQQGRIHKQSVNNLLHLKGGFKGANSEPRN